MRDGGRNQSRAEALHVCPACASHLVQPLSWERAADRGQWHLWRRCPECEWIAVRELPDERPVAQGP